LFLFLRSLAWDLLKKTCALPCGDFALLFLSPTCDGLRPLKKFLQKHPQPDPNGLIFRSRRSAPRRETNALHDGLHSALRAPGLPKAGSHAFRRGCNQRWELSGLIPAVICQQMGHSSAAMTALYSGQIPLDKVRAAISEVQFPNKSGNKIVVLENVENGPAA